MIPLVGITAATWLLAVFLNRRAFRRLQLPDSLVAGLLLLLAGPQIGNLLPADFYESWKAWPGTLIAFLFAGLIFEPGERLKERRARSVLIQASYVWMLAFLQLALGYGICAVLAHPEDRLFAHVIELSWLGGPGSASAFLAVSERLGNRTAGDLSVAAAAAGLVWGSASGLVLASYHRRRLQASHRQAPNAVRITHDGAHATTIPTVAPVASAHDLLVSFLLPLLPVLAAWILREGLSSLAPSQGAGAKMIEDLPLFFIVIPVAYALRPLLPPTTAATGVRLFHHLSLEGLILSAMATLGLATLQEHLGIFSVLAGGAAILSLACHLILSPRLLPHHPDLSLINYGMATGTTALGIMLLRTYRTEPDVHALEIYGLATPLSAPFIGGGIISLLVLPELTVRIPAAILFAVMLLGAVLMGSAAYLLRDVAASSERI